MLRKYLVFPNCFSCGSGLHFLCEDSAHKRQLRYLYLSHSKCLNKIPDFSWLLLQVSGSKKVTLCILSIVYRPLENCLLTPSLRLLLWKTQKWCVCKCNNKSTSLDCDIKTLQSFMLINSSFHHYEDPDIYRNIFFSNMFLIGNAFVAAEEDRNTKVGVNK